MEPLIALERAGKTFRRRLEKVQPEDWDRATPCEGWTVRELVIHVVGGNLMGAALVRGATRDDALEIFAATDLGEDPLAAFDGSQRAQLDAFTRAEDLSAPVAHPAGDLPGAQVLGFRVADLLVHTWDLARAVGADETLDPQLVEDVWQASSPMAPFIGELGMFGGGPSGRVREDAPLQERLLDLFGRRP